MDDSTIIEKFKVLMDNGLTQGQAEEAVAGGLYFQKMGGTSVDSYWKTSASFDIRDEFYLISNTHFLLANIAQKIDAEDWLLKFQVVYLYQLKQNAQSIRAIDVLSSLKCYADALAVCRALQSRINLLLLCGFSPDLFDHWLKNPKDPKWLDGHVRQELESHGVHTMDHVYELASEIIHGQYLGHANIGYFEKGLFGEIPAIRNQVFVIAKFLISCIILRSSTGNINWPKEDVKY